MIDLYVAFTGAWYDGEIETDREYSLEHYIAGLQVAGFGVVERDEGGVYHCEDPSNTGVCHFSTDLSALRSYLASRPKLIVEFLNPADDKEQAE